jgi:hypothetical protein
MTDDDASALLLWLERWYARHCNGEWEHAYGVQMESLDNPGWIVRVDLTATELEQAPFQPFEELRTETDWVNCSRTAEQLVCAGGPLNLMELLSVFRAWAERAQTA